jgi:hypothetical protein
MAERRFHAKSGNKFIAFECAHFDPYAHELLRRVSVIELVEAADHARSEHKDPESGSHVSITSVRRADMEIARIHLEKLDGTLTLREVCRICEEAGFNSTRVLDADDLDGPCKMVLSLLCPSCSDESLKALTDQHSDATLHVFLHDHATS